MSGEGAFGVIGTYTRGEGGGGSHEIAKVNDGIGLARTSCVGLPRVQGLAKRLSSVKTGRYAEMPTRAGASLQPTSQFDPRRSCYTRVQRVKNGQKDWSKQGGAQGSPLVPPPRKRPWQTERRGEKILCTAPRNGPTFPVFCSTYPPFLSLRPLSTPLSPEPPSSLFCRLSTSSFPFCKHRGRMGPS